MSKLPELILFEEYGNNWDAYVEAIYTIFCKEIKNYNLKYQGKKVILKRYPLFKNKEKAFWHLTSEGRIEEQRVPSLPRCERISWIKFIIENKERGFVRVWKNKRGQKSHVCLSLKSFEYIVVLAERKNYFLLLSAYPIEYEWRRKKLEREYRRYKKQNPLC